MIRAGLDGAEARAHETIVVGSGPAGLTLAMELARRGRPTLVLESGLDRPSDAQDLARAEIVDPTRHDDMRIATVRRLGGTSNLWGGRSMPLDPVDFVPRPFVGGVRWPIGYDDVARYYATACRYVGCGEAAFTLAAPGLSAANGDFEFDRIERASNRPWFQKAHAATLAASPLIDIRLGATVIEIEFAENGRATGVVAATADGRRLRLAAERIALAAGGLESTRLLLAAQRRRPALFGGADGPLGRYYMGHVIGEIADVVFDDARVDAAFDFLRDGRGSFVRRRFAPSPVADGALRPAQRRLLAGGPANRRPASRQRRALGRRDGAVDADRRRHDPAGADPRPPSRRVDRLARPWAQRRFRPAGDPRLSRPVHA